MHFFIEMIIMIFFILILSSKDISDKIIIFEIISSNPNQENSSISSIFLMTINMFIAMILYFPIMQIFRITEQIKLRLLCWITLISLCEFTNLLIIFYAIHYSSLSIVKFVQGFIILLFFIVKKRESKSSFTKKELIGSALISIGIVIIAFKIFITNDILGTNSIGFLFLLIYSITSVISAQLEKRLNNSNIDQYLVISLEGIFGFVFIFIFFTFLFFQTNIIIPENINENNLNKISNIFIAFHDFLFFSNKLIGLSLIQIVLMMCYIFISRNYIYQFDNSKKMIIYSLNSVISWLFSYHSNWEQNSIIHIIVFYLIVSGMIFLKNIFSDYLNSFEKDILILNEEYLKKLN